MTNDMKDQIAEQVQAAIDGGKFDDKLLEAVGKKRSEVIDFTKLDGYDAVVRNYSANAQELRGDGDLEYRAIAATATDDPEILIYDMIDDFFGISAEMIAKDLQDFKKDKPKNINVRVNSPGGSVFSGIAIENVLRQFPANITMYIDGIAASAASLIAMAGDTIKMADTAVFMIHKPYTGTAGDADELRKTADLLDLIQGSITTSYKRRTGLSKDALNQMVNEETWFNAEEALENKFIDEIVDGNPMQNCAFDLDKWAKHLKAPAEVVNKLRPSFSLEDAVKRTEQMAARMEKLKGL